MKIDYILMAVFLWIASGICISNGDYALMIITYVAGVFIFFKMPTKTERYFIVTFFGYRNNGTESHGNLNFNQVDGNYLNEYFIINYIKTTHSLEKVMITNIIEINKKDSDEWMSLETITRKI